MLGRHQEELEEALRGGQIYGGSFNLRSYEARALAALGRLDDLDRLVQGLLTVAPQTFSHYFLPRATPGHVMLSAAEDLRTHGHREAALTMANRAVDWFQGRVGDEARLEDIRSGLGDALYQAERWQEAKAVVTELATHPADYYFDIYDQGRLGALAARTGDVVTARRIAEALRNRKDRWLDGKHTFRAARIVALLGDKDAAVALLREAIAQGAGISEVPDAVRLRLHLQPLHGPGIAARLPAVRKPCQTERIKQVQSTLRVPGSQLRHVIIPAHGLLRSPASGLVPTTRCPRVPPRGPSRAGRRRSRASPAAGCPLSRGDGRKTPMRMMFSRDACSGSCVPVMQKPA